MARARVVRLVCALALAVAAASIAAHPALAATTRHVSPTGSDSGNCTANPCKTIGYAIGQSVSGDTIDIASGTYSEHVLVDRSLRLQGSGAASTIIDGSNSGTVITIGAPSESLMVKVNGLTVHNGKAQTEGGGLLSVPGSGQSNAVTLNAVVVANNHVKSIGSVSALGGGIYNGSGSTLTLNRSTVQDNTAQGGSVHPPAVAGSGLGGGIYNAGSLIVAMSTVAGNAGQGGNGCSLLCAYGKGGGVDNVGLATIVQSTLSGNEAMGGTGGQGRGSGGQR